VDDPDKEMKNHFAGPFPGEQIKLSGYKEADGCD
jgi:hypothetical protein